MSKKLSKDAVLKVDDRKIEWFEVPEWGGSVPLRAPNAWEQSEYQQSLMDIEADGRGGFKTKPKMTGANVRLAAIGIADENGLWFTVDELRDKSSGAINRIAARLREMSGMDADVEDAEGN